uniref:Putative secreted protein n=1 Tax=Panstrongylus lignarius TaxID=156445 RepID=A0A224XYI4_9HEMI
MYFCFLSFCVTPGVCTLPPCLPCSIRGSFHAQDVLSHQPSGRLSALDHPIETVLNYLRQLPCQSKAVDLLAVLPIRALLNLKIIPPYSLLLLQ